jgi:hypothetical protein
MDTFRAFEDSAEFDLQGEDEPAIEVPPEIGVDERRMHVRAYNHWVSLLDGRAYPNIADLEPDQIDDFGPYSVLLDFTGGSDNPAIAYIGRELRGECNLSNEMRFISDVPSRSLLSRLTDHYLQIIANCAPIGFEAEFVSQRGHNTMYRGILMPYSSDGDTIDFIYGVINWKEVADHATSAGIESEASRAAALAPLVEASPIWADGPHADALASAPFAPPLSAALEFGLQADDAADQHDLDLPMDPNAGLADRLCIARESAEAVKASEVRSRSALYRALGQAYDFALAAEAAPDDYAEILDDAGLKAQDRAPMTPIVKLIFGIDYDKTRLTEFAAALSYGRREGIGQGELQPFLEGFGGGLKAIVQAERRTRRPVAKPDGGDAARDAIRSADVIAYLDLVTEGAEEFVLLVARREPNGNLAVIAPVAHDPALIDKAIRKSEI